MHLMDEPLSTLKEEFRLWFFSVLSLVLNQITVSRLVLLLRTNFLRVKNAVIVIQKFWRGYCCRKNYQIVSPLHNQSDVNHPCLPLYSLYSLYLCCIS